MRKKILAVDDEPLNLASIRRILQDEYDLVFATSGRGAIEMLEKHHPDLILLDVHMPGLSGHEVCQWVMQHSLYREIPVIFLTGASDPGEEERGFDLGAVDFLLKPTQPSVMRARIKTHLSLVKSVKLARIYEESIHMLGVAGHYNDSDTGSHTCRVGDTAGALARVHGYSDEASTELTLAATLHDVGKIGIPDSILRKPGALDAHEWKVMTEHSRIGHTILSRSDVPLFHLAAEIALHHHEKWDGNGYPDGLCQKQISEASRIVAVADVYDALTTKRPYKEPWSTERALEIIEQEGGKHFDPHFASLFAGMGDQLAEIRKKWNLAEDDENAA